MLIKKNIKKGSIIAMKLTTGDELIAKVVSHDVEADKLVISKPIAVGMAPTGAVAFMPFMVGATDDVELTFDLRHHVVTHTIAREELKNAYIQNTTGLVTAGSTPKGLIGS